MLVGVSLGNLCNRCCEVRIYLFKRQTMLIIRHSRDSLCPGNRWLLLLLLVCVAGWPQQVRGVIGDVS